MFVCIIVLTFVFNSTSPKIFVNFQETYMNLFQLTTMLVPTNMKHVSSVYVEI